jgi:hypothetical protein
MRVSLLSLCLGCSALLTGAPAVLAADPAGAAAPSGPPPSEPGSWQPHSYDFHFMGFTSTYSCDGLADKLKVLLRAAGAGPDAKVEPFCARGFGVPDKLVQAKVVFSSLQAGTSATPSTAAPGGAQGVEGAWRHVELTPRHPFELQLGDCELVEQFRDRLLPMFQTRNVTNQVTCVPHEESGSNFTLGFDVFAPLGPRKGG